MSLPVLILGAGGHARVLLDALGLSGVRVLGLLDADPAKHGQELLGARVLGGEGLLDGYAPEAVALVNAVGSVRSMEVRAAVYERFKGRGYSFPVVRHPSAVVAGDADIGPGVHLLAGSVVITGTAIGPNTIVNTKASVDHDGRIGAHVHLAPGVTLSGGVRVGERTHIGTGASVVQFVHVGSRCLVAAGAVVVKDVPDGARVMGVPARVVEQ